MVFFLKQKKIYEQCKFTQLTFPKLIVNKFKFFFIYNNFFKLNYKGYRFIFGLPVNGQRTWSNSKTAKRLNVALKSFKELKLLKYLKQAQIKKFVFVSEYLNFIYKLNWYHEWSAHKAHFFRIIKKSKFIKPSLNLLFLQHKKVDTLCKHRIRKLAKSKKNSKKKKPQNFIQLGLNFGYITLFSQNFKLMLSLKKFICF